MASINGYELESGWKNVANGAFAYGRKGGKRYFIKRLSSPVYPDDPALYPPGADSTLRTKAYCAEFEKEFNEKMKALKTARGKCDLLVQPEEFFRVRAKYYLASDAVEGKSLEPEEVSKLPQSERYNIMRDFAESLAALESVNIIHGDIKPTNVLIVKKDGRYRPLLIDFDDCYFSGRPPKNTEETIGSPEFYSPELGSYISKKDPSRGSMVTCASDVFAAAVLFFQYQTGQALRPKKTDGHVYPFQVFSDEMEFCGADEGFVSLLKAMLEVKAEDRPKPKDIPDLITKVEKGGKVMSKTSDMILLKREDHKLFIIKDGRRMGATKSSAIEYSAKYSLDIVDEGGEKVTAEELEAIFGKDKKTPTTVGIPIPPTGPDGPDTPPAPPTGEDYVLVKDGKYFIVIGGKRKSAPKDYALKYAKEHGLEIRDDDGDTSKPAPPTDGHTLGVPAPPGPDTPPAPPTCGDYVLVKDGKYFLVIGGKRKSAPKDYALKYAKDKGLEFRDETGNIIKID